MRPSALLLMCVCALGSARDIHMRVVVDANSPADYNRWVWQHREECRFPTVCITLDSWARRGEFDCPAISFWTDSGPLLTHRILPDSQLAPPPEAQMAPTCEISQDMDQLAVPSRGRGFAMYDRFGTRLFTDPHRITGLTSGRWIRSGWSASRTELLDDSGSILSTISPTGRAGVYFASDSVLALHADSTVVLLDRNGQVLWRSRKLASHSVLAVAPNGSALAAATGDSLVICSAPGTKTVVLPHDTQWKHFDTPTMVWSADGNLLAVYQRSQTAWDSGRVFVVNTKGRLVRPARKLQFCNIRGFSWIGDTVVLPAVNVDLANVPLQFRTWASADSYVVTFLPPGGGIDRGVIHGRFVLRGGWVTSGRYLAYVDDRHYLIAECGAGREPGRSGSR
jgi:hypothetical protein